MLTKNKATKKVIIPAFKKIDDSKLNRLELKKKKDSLLNLITKAQPKTLGKCKQR